MSTYVPLNRRTGRLVSIGRLAPEPFAAAATWGRTSSAFGAVLAVMAVALSRSGVVDPRAALAVLAFALLFAIAGIGFAIRSAVVIWRTGRRGAGRSLTALVLATAVLAYPTYLGLVAARLPPIGDVSTDPAAPPPFSNNSAARAARGGIDHEDASAQMRDAQRRLYPGLQPVMLDRSGEEAYALVLKAVQARGWRIVEAAPPRGKFGTGHIDAITADGVMGLPDDIAIRIRPLSGQARVDIRSAVRFGPSDFGAGASRIQSLSDGLLDADS